MLPHINPGIPYQGCCKKQGRGPRPVEIAEEKGRPKDIGGMIGGEGKGAGAGPEDMDSGQEITGPGAGEKVFKEKTIGIVQNPYQKNQYP